MTALSLRTNQIWRSVGKISTKSGVTIPSILLQINENYTYKKKCFFKKESSMELHNLPSQSEGEENKIQVLKCNFNKTWLNNMSCTLVTHDFTDNQRFVQVSRKKKVAIVFSKDI